MSNKQQFSTRERKNNKKSNTHNIYSSKHIRLVEKNIINNKNTNTDTDIKTDIAIDINNTNSNNKNIKNSKEKIDKNSKIFLK